MATKVFVVIRAKNLPAGFYDHFDNIVDHVTGVKKAEGYDVTWRKFEGRNCLKGARAYWNEHYTEPPPQSKSFTQEPPFPTAQIRPKNDQGEWGVANTAQLKSTRTSGTDSSAGISAETTSTLL